MDYDVQVTLGVHEKVLDSVGYIATVFAAPMAASSLLDSYQRSLESLRVNPTFNPVSHVASKRLKRRIYRKSVKSYSLYFFVEEKERRVVVFSFLHRGQDVPARLAESYEDIQ